MVAVRRLRRLSRPLIEADNGVTSIEYVLIASLIAVLLVGVVGLIGGQVESFFSQIAAAL